MIDSASRRGVRSSSAAARQTVESQSLDQQMALPATYSMQAPQAAQAAQAAQAPQTHTSHIVMPIPIVDRSAQLKWLAEETTLNAPADPLHQNHQQRLQFGGYGSPPPQVNTHTFQAAVEHGNGSHSTPEASVLMGNLFHYQLPQRLQNLPQTYPQPTQMPQMPQMPHLSQLDTANSKPGQYWSEYANNTTTSDSKPATSDSLSTGKAKALPSSPVVVNGSTGWEHFCGLLQHGLQPVSNVSMGTGADANTSHYELSARLAQAQPDESGDSWTQFVMELSPVLEATEMEDEIVEDALEELPSDALATLLDSSAATPAMISAVRRCMSAPV